MAPDVVMSSRAAWKSTYLNVWLLATGAELTNPPLTTRIRAASVPAAITEAVPISVRVPSSSTPGSIVRTTSCSRTTFEGSSRYGEPSSVRVVGVVMSDEITVLAPGTENDTENGGPSV